jgi:hypothetical protein
MRNDWMNRFQTIRAVAIGGTVVAIVILWLVRWWRPAPADRLRIKFGFRTLTAHCSAHLPHIDPQ